MDASLPLLWLLLRFACLNACLVTAYPPAGPRADCLIMADFYNARDFRPYPAIGWGCLPVPVIQEQ